MAKSSKPKKKSSSSKVKASDDRTVNTVSYRNQADAFMSRHRKHMKVQENPFAAFRKKKKSDG